MNGEHSELYTYDLYTNKLKNEGWQYYTTNSWEQPCLYKFLENNNCKYEIDILWDIKTPKGFFVEIFENKENKENEECLNTLLSNIPFIIDNFKNEIIEGVYKHPSLRSNKYFNLYEIEDFIESLETFLKEFLNYNKPSII